MLAAPEVAPARQRSGSMRLLAASALVGVLAGGGGAALTLLLHAVQHFAFGYTEATFLIGVERAPSWRRVLAPAAGGLIVALGWWWLRRHADAEEVSVTRALREPGRPLPVRVTLADAVLQIVAVGAGASLGREGAPRQAGAALAGWLSGRLRLSASQRRTLIACGAGAGLSAVYDVPAAGAVFALEVLLASYALRDVVSAVVSSGLATLVAWPVLTDHPVYQVGRLGLAWPVLCWSLAAGPLVGVAGVAFSWLAARARTHAVAGGRTVPAMVLALAGLGAVAIGWPEVLGNGKGQAELAFSGAIGVGLAAMLTLLKPLAAALCLRAGTIGGLLTPALATGATLGACLGGLWSRWWPGGALGAYAVVGAAALLAVTQRAPLTALVLPLELLHTGLTLLPATMLAAVLAVGTASLLDPALTVLGGRRPRNLLRRANVGGP